MPKKLKSLMLKDIPEYKENKSPTYLRGSIEYHIYNCNYGAVVSILECRDWLEKVKYLRILADRIEEMIENDPNFVNICVGKNYYEKDLKKLKQRRG